MAGLGKNEIDIIFESTYDGMIAVNRNGIVTLFNKAAERMTGLSSKVVLGKPAVDVIPNTRLHIVLAEVVAEIGQEQIERSRLILRLLPKQWLRLKRLPY